MQLNRTQELISLIKEEANRFIDEELKKKGIHGIVTSHGSILMALYKNNKMTMKEISEKINRKQPTVTVLIDKLLSHGYVSKEKNVDDSRITFIHLTKKGEEFRSIFFDISKKMNRRMLNGLSNEDSETLENLLERVSKNW